jgi:hypothetical protein
MTINDSAIRTSNLSPSGPSVPPRARKGSPSPSQLSEIAKEFRRYGDGIPS